ncbi:MAG: DUF3108 domain-containing protein [Desulfatitalea sp.]
MFLLLLAAAPAPLHAERVTPFAPGERLTFALRWSVIPAGEAVLEVLPMETIQETRAFHFRLTAQSNAFMDLFYKVRDRIDSYVDAEVTRGLHYEKVQHEGKAQRNVRVVFDWRKGTAQYSDEKRTRAPIAIPPGTFDPLSVFFYSRLLPWEENLLIQCPVTDGVKYIQGRGRIVQRQTLCIGDRTYDTFLIEPDMEHISGVFEKRKNAKIKVWVTADAKRIPVKVTSKAPVGTFVGELLTIEEGVR